MDNWLCLIVPEEEEEKKMPQHYDVGAKQPSNDERAEAMLADMRHDQQFFIIIIITINGDNDDSIIFMSCRDVVPLFFYCSVSGYRICIYAWRKIMCAHDKSKSLESDHAAAAFVFTIII